MKKKLITFSFFITLIISIVLYRRLSDQLDYHFNPNAPIPLKGNLVLLTKEQSQKYLPSEKYGIYIFQDLSKHRIKAASGFTPIPSGTISYLLGNQKSNLLLDFDKFYIEEDLLYIITYHSLRQSTVIILPLKMSKRNLFWEKLMNSDVYITDISPYENKMKTPEEWQKIWKRDGHLPWFPENTRL